MTQQETNRIIAITKNIENIKILMAELFMPINTLKQKYNYDTLQETAENKLKVEEYLNKFGILTLDNSIKALKQIAKGQCHAT